MAFVHRKLWSFKPKQYGPWKVVHRNMMHNLERVYGVDPNSGVLSHSMWGSGDQYDYSQSATKWGSNSATFKNNSTMIDDAQSLSLSSSSLANSIGTTKLLTIVTSVNVLEETTSFHRIFAKDKLSAGNYRDIDLYIEDANAIAGNINFTTGDDISSRLEVNSSEFEIGKPITIAARQGVVEKRLFVSGESIGSSLNTDAFSVAADSFWIGNWSDTGTRGLEGYIDFLFLFNDDLPDSKIALLSDNPYQIWQPVPQKTIFLPLGGASATLTGTAITGGVTESEIVTGGDTIIITLTGDTWVATVGDDSTPTDDLIAGITSAQSETNGWNNVVKANMVFGDVARTSDTIVTITLAAEAAYSITSNETITITIPATALTAATEVIATPNIIVANESAGGMVKRLVDDGLLQGLTVGRLAA